MPELRPLAWRRFASEVLSLYAPPIRRPSTYRKTRQALREFGRVCRTTGDVSPAAIAAWIARHPDRGDSTRLTLLRTFRPVCTYGASQGYLIDPFVFRKPRQWLASSAVVGSLEAFPRHRTAAEIALLLAQADLEAQGGRWEARRLRAAVYAWCFTGARKNEILGARTADVDLAAGMLAIVPNPRRPLKTAASRARLPIPGTLAAVLAAWIPHCGSEWLMPSRYRRTPWMHGPHRNKALDQVRELGARAGVPGLTILALRHSFGTLSEGWGWGELTLQRQLRHSRPATQVGYRHEDLHQMRVAASKIRYDCPN